MPSATPPDDVVRLDATRVKTLAHPLRSRLLSELRRGGPATATTLATALQTNTGATSYHLRRLAAVGLVRDTGEGTGKQRLWAAATDYTQWDPSDFAGDEDAETALNWLVRDYLRHFDTRFERWLDVEAHWPAPWRDALGMSDDAVLVTAEQAAAMSAELAEVVTRYRRVGQGNPQARRVAVYVTTYPIDLDRPPLAGRR
ncbi:MAG TPA: helix-turn-helix domain-containing protein [Dermatophilaceae bacterium]|nr:helix-turn-helix domain-containing protein [Dermatophilaceae bacterium]